MEIQLPPKFEGMFKPKRVKVFYGGRGGAKTESFATVAAYMAASEGKQFLCLREYQNSILESVHSTIKTVLERNKMEHLFIIQNSQILHAGTGKVAFSYGQLARNVESIKSRQGIDVAWIEEGETISRHSLDILVPTIRKPGSEIWISFNPADEFGAVYAEYVHPHKEEIDKNGFYEDDYCYVCKVGLEDNPFAPNELLLESRKCRERDYKEWLHIWGGEPIRDYTDSLIKPEWVRAAVDSHKELNWQPRGLRVLGFDPADTGKDMKALCGRHGSMVTKLDAWADGNLSDAIERAFCDYRDWDADVLVYDAIGVGSAVKVAHERDDPARRLKIEPFVGSGTPVMPDATWRDRSNRDTFKNRRAQGYWNLAARFEATYNAIEKNEYTDPDMMISLPSDLPLLDTLRAEISAIRRVRRAGSSLLQVESKEEMLRRGMKSPNIADALMYAFGNVNFSPDAENMNIDFTVAWS